jgi:hypothetical protein
MVELIEPPWMTFDEVASFLVLPEEDVARLLLDGTFRFEVVKRTPNPDLVTCLDVRIATDDVRAFQRDRWFSSKVKSDELVNRAAMKYRKHPTRTTPGVRGRARKK